ncbi:MAG: hypothetical protein Q8L37_05710 [Candidatus Gottesmanbacteria bacterium]|nr:hypothetical protein [Candidatus Gottesmanbacteria bacterium]
MCEWVEKTITSSDIPQQSGIFYRGEVNIMKPSELELREGAAIAIHVDVKDVKIINGIPEYRPELEPKMMFAGEDERRPLTLRSDADVI